MSDQCPRIEDEIEDHKSELERMIVAADTMPVPPSYKGVVDRFRRDCQTLVNDLDEKESPALDDLNDFKDRRASLEIQFINITDRLK